MFVFEHNHKVDEIWCNDDADSFLDLELSTYKPTAMKFIIMKNAKTVVKIKENHKLNRRLTQRQ